MDTKTIKRISTWGKIVGIISMIFGILSALGGLFLFIVGAIPGLISTYLGYLIYKTGRAAGEYLEQESDEAIVEMLEAYSKYLLVSGILVIISLVVALIGVFVGGIGVFTLLGLSN